MSIDLTKPVKRIILLLALSSFLGAAELHSIQLLDLTGAPVVNAVIEIEAVPLGKPLSVADDYVMDQIDFRFAPVVLTIPRGADVRFPNSDDSRHHVYSFSEAKTFELKLYSGNQAPPVNFDTNGIVAVGCNIHDKMNAHIYITEAPIVSMSDQTGLVSIPKHEPSADQRIQVWHPFLMTPLTFSFSELNIDKNNHATLTLPIALPVETESSGSTGLRDRLKSFKSNGN